MRKELEEPTEVEIELKRRLDQLTDHLIQKQSQVYMTTTVNKENSDKTNSLAKFTRSKHFPQRKQLYRLESR